MAVVCAVLVVIAFALREGSRQSSAAAAERLLDSICLQQPTVDCLAKSGAALALLASDNRQFANIAQNLAGAGHFTEAEQLLLRVTDPQQRQMTDQAIAIQRIALAARAEPGKVADLSPIEQLTEIPGTSIPITVERASAYHLLALDLLGRHPFSGGGNSDVVAAEKAAWRRPASFPTLTLDRVTERRKALISDLPPNFRGMAWTDLADTLIDLSKTEEAKEALEAALSTTGPEFVNLIARQWLRLGNANRALQVLDTSNKPYAPAYLDIAEAMLSCGENASSISPILAKSFVHARVALVGTPDFALERRIIALAQKIGDDDGIAQMKETVVKQARLPGPFQPANLATAAAVSVDLGDHETGRALLTEGKRAFPKDEHAVVAVGMVAGPISYSTWHMGDRMRTALAIQYYRLGDTAEFEELFSKVSADFRMETWQKLFEESMPPGVAEPMLADVLADAEPGQRASLVALVAAQWAGRAETAKAKTLLEDLLRLTDENPGKNDLGALMNGTRLALALDRTDLVRQFFRRQVASIAATKSDAGISALRLSGAAAFLAEWLNGESRSEGAR